MRLIKKIWAGVAWRLRVYVAPLIKPLAAIFEKPWAEDLLYSWTNARYDRLLKKHFGGSVSGPKVAIIIPVYNVAKYLDVCVKSALLQTHRNLEIVLVNDGSTDNSGEIAQGYADLDARVTLITQKNAGLAAARNAGVRAVKAADYLLFLDSDDVLPLGAVQSYLDVVGDGNVAVGKPTRLKGLLVYKRNRELFRKDARGLDLLKNPAYLSDVTACNKLIRFDFWKRGGYEFPVGFLYEDMALITKIYAESGGFAVQHKTTYYWRMRVSGGASITQERYLQRNLEHRLKAIEDTFANLQVLYPKTPETAALWSYYNWAVARYDINFYLPWVEHTDAVYFATLQRTAAHLYGDVASSFWGSMPERYRAALKALVAGDREAVIAAIRKSHARVTPPSA